MQKQTSNQKDFVDKDLRNILKENYYFQFEEKSRLHQRASYLFVLLIPMFAVLLNLFDTYKNPQPIEIFFLLLLTLFLSFSIVFLIKSLTFHNYFYTASLQEILKYKKELKEYNDKIQKPDTTVQEFDQFLATEYAKHSAYNEKTNKNRVLCLRRTAICIIFFIIILLTFYFYIFFIKTGNIIILYKYLVNCFL